MSKELTITLPLPDRVLSPNSRKHWAVVAQAKKRARRRAYLIAMEQWSRPWGAAPPRFSSYRLCFIWPDRRRRDRDNAAASCKAYLDGIADAIGQDDSEWDFDGVRTAIAIEKGQAGLEIIFTEDEKS